MVQHPNLAVDAGGGDQDVNFVPLRRGLHPLDEIFHGGVARDVRPVDHDLLRAWKLRCGRGDRVHVCSVHTYTFECKSFPLRCGHLNVEY